MTDFVKARDKLISMLKSETHGPEPFGEIFDTSGGIKFNRDDQAVVDLANQIKEKSKNSVISDDKAVAIAMSQIISMPYIDKDSKQEIMSIQSPREKYGSGILFPIDEDNSNGDEDDTTIPNFTEENEERSEAFSINFQNTKQPKITERDSQIKGEDSEIEIELPGSNLNFQNSLGVSFNCELPKDFKIVIENLDEPSGVYEKNEIVCDGEKKKNKFWWIRKEMRFKALFEINNILSKSDNFSYKPSTLEITESKLKLEFQIFVRSFDNANIITAVLINKTVGSKFDDSLCLFQSGFKVKILDQNDNPVDAFKSYPKGKLEQELVDSDPEERTLELIYRNHRTFAIGHGCSANWINNKSYCNEIQATCFPTIELPNVTADLVEEKDLENIKLPMNVLAGLKDGNIYDVCQILINMYSKWIMSKERELPLLEEEILIVAAQDNLKKCKECLGKIKEGLDFIKSDANALKAFQLANQSVLIQQIRSKQAKRDAYINENKILSWKSPHKDFNYSEDKEDVGNWRPFQLGFILSSIKSTVLNTDKARDDVELIFFPTGGGKTEAYLGLIAFTSLYKRLVDKDDNGVQVIMRYTLRLLTTQQFSRASSLICAMESIRRQNPSSLGEKPFSIGVWLGSSSTPNSMKDGLYSAQTFYKKLLNSRDYDEKLKNNYKFLITKCPWCAAQIGVIKKDNRGKSSRTLVGLKTDDNGNIVFKCDDKKCEFNESPLPVYVVDDDIYDKTPTVLIGTVDKFAQLTWKPRAKSIFGLDINGNRICPPPSLIIQDELHLITGPLGSMVGLYETLIEDLCTLKDNNGNSRPKIICSTATIRNYGRQIKDLYNRNNVNLFPPLGIESSDSFFSRDEINEDGSYKNPKIYVGITTPNYNSIQTAQVRVYSRLLYAYNHLDPDERDPWFTLMNFFGSIRELSNTMTLIQIDIVDQMEKLRKRYNDDYSNVRNIFNLTTKELTSRMPSESIGDAIDELEVSYPADTKNNKYPIDICNASNIIEVGVDIPRLSLLTVLGQPKTTSSYIQVTGRIGRRKDRPGLVFTIYNNRRPRDKSHFEQFKSYHQRLYAQVEPMSVTSYATPILERALHAVLVAYVRMYGNSEESESPSPLPEKLFNDFKNILLKRQKEIDDSELSFVDKKINELKSQWSRWEHSRFHERDSEQDAGLLTEYGSYLSEDQRFRTWMTPTSLRNVDAECKTGLPMHAIEQIGDEDNEL